MRLERINWTQAEEYFKHNDMVIIGTGSIECHGKHVALGTDFLVPSKIIELMEPRTDVLIAPTMPYGSCQYLTDFPGTVNLGYDVLYAVMTKITESLYKHGARKFLFMNGHGGNTPVLQRIGSEMTRKGCLCAIIDWWSLAGRINPKWKGGHAGAEETSAMMVVAPEAVHMELAMEFAPIDLTDELTFAASDSVYCDGVTVQVPRPTAAYSKSGWFGDDHINTASVEWGEEMLTGVADFIASFIDKFSRAQCPDLSV